MSTTPFPPTDYERGLKAAWTALDQLRQKHLDAAAVARARDWNSTAERFEGYAAAVREAQDIVAALPSEADAQRAAEAQAERVLDAETRGCL